MAKEAGAVLVFDEVSSGFRLTTGGAHLTLNIEPDIAVFAKAISNGYPMAAIIGRDEVMKAVEQTFISSTNWTDRIGPVAALATLHKHQKLNVSSHLSEIGKSVQSLWLEAAAEAGLSVHVYGIYPMSYFRFDGVDALPMMTYYTQEMLKLGFLAGGRFYANFAQQAKHVEKFGIAMRMIFKRIATLSQQGSLVSHLEGGVAKPGFHRLN